MVRIGVERWAAWPSPGAATAEPDVGFLPPLLRRRCSRLTRMMLHAARAACPDERRATLPIVFASRYGEVAVTVGLLEALARREPLTASAFSHSVHNAQAALFTIAEHNQAPASAVAAGPDTFGAAFLEAVVAADRGGGAVLLVVGDEPLPPTFARFEDGPPLSYAAALVLGPTGTPLEFAPATAALPLPPVQPDALRFLEWLVSSEPCLTLGIRTAYTWTRR